MKHATIKCTVCSDRQAAEILNICRKFWASAKLFSLGYIGGYFHEAPALYEVQSETEANHRAAWSKFVDYLTKHGYYNVLY
jgi:hypothetical protein